MKNLFTLLTCSFLALTLNGQSYLKKIVIKNTSTSILGELVEVPEDRTVLFGKSTPDEGFLLVTSYEAPNIGHAQSLALQKHNAEGEVEWARAYPGLFVLSHEPQPRAAIQMTPDGGLIGVFDDDDLDAVQVVRFNAFGDILWAKRIVESDAYYTNSYGITMLKNGDVLHIGGIGQSGQFTILRLDGTTGEKLADYGIKVSASQYLIKSFEATADGGVIMLGQTGSTPLSSQSIIALKLNSQMELDWVSRMVEEQGILATAIYEMEDTYKVVGQNDDLISIFTLNNMDGRVIRARAFLPETGGTNHEPFLPISRDGKRLFFAGTGFEDYNQRFVPIVGAFDLVTDQFEWIGQDLSAQGNLPVSEGYMKMQKNGVFAVRGNGAIYLQQYSLENGSPWGCSGTTYQASQWNTYEGEVLNTFWPVQFTPPASYQVANSTINQVLYTCTEEMQCQERPPLELAEQITIAPNPTLDFVRIALPGYHDLELQLTLFDVAGRLLNHQKRWIDGVIDYDLSALPAGTYYLQFQAGNEVFGKKVVKVSP